MKKFICFFLAVLFITAILVSCELGGNTATTATTREVDVITDTTATTAGIVPTEEATVPTGETPTTAETTATTVPTETASTTVATEPTSTEATTTAESTTATTGATTEPMPGIIQSGSEPPTRIKGVMCAAVPYLIRFLSSENTAELSQYFGEPYVSQHKDEYFNVLSKIAKFETVFFPSFNGETNVLSDRDYPIHVTIESDGRYEVLFNIDHDGYTGNFSLLNHNLSTAPEKVNDVAMFVLGEKKTVYWREYELKDGTIYSSAFFKYGDAWISFNLNNCRYDKLFEYLEKLELLPLDAVKYTSNKPLLKRVEEMTVLPTDIGSDDYDNFKGVWFGGDIGDVENNRTKTFGLKAGEIYVGFDKATCGDKKIAVNVFAFDEAGNEVDPATIAPYFTARDIETYFWDNTATIIIDKDQFDKLDGVLNVPGRDKYRFGYFLAALPLQKPTISGETDGGMNEFEVVKFDFGEYSIAEILLGEIGEELSNENVSELTFIIQKSYWSKLLKYYGLKDEALAGFKVVSLTPPVVSAFIVTDNNHLDVIANMDGYFVRMKITVPTEE